MELDTGAAYSVISEATFRRAFSHLKLRPSEVLLKSYTSERIQVLGQLNVHVHYGDQRARLVLLVVASNGRSLLGRNWLHYIRLDWKKLHSVLRSTELSDLLHENNVLFKDELGKIEHCEATLHVRPDAHPRFFKARPVPLAIKPSIEEELDKLEASGVIKKLSTVSGLPQSFQFQRRMDSSSFVVTSRSPSIRPCMLTSILLPSWKTSLHH